MSIYVKDIERGVRVRPGSTFLEPFCDGWRDRMSKYEVAERGDYPFWYGERSLVGFLAAGIWDTGGVCIEEFRTEKKAAKTPSNGQTLKLKKSRTDAKERTGETFSGRGDLYFRRGKRAGNIEFKRYDIGISRTDHFEAFLKTRWRKIEEDARKGHQKGIDDYGGMFLRPYVGKDRTNRSVGRYDANLKTLLEKGWNTRKPDALAWWCPTKQVVEEDEENTKNLLVGVILLIKRVK